MMKRYLILTMALAIVSTGCRKNAPGSGESAATYEVTVESTFNNQTPDQVAEKASRAQEFEDFAQGAKVGLFMVDFTATSTHGTLQTYGRSEAKPDGNSAHNVLYVANADGVLATMPAVHYTKDLAFNVDLFAYYPHTTTYDAPSSMTALPFAVLQDQSKAVNIANSDLCWSKSDDAGVAPSPNAVAMKFYHKLAKIKVVLIIPASVSGKTVKEITNIAFQDIKTSVTLNMSTGVTTTIDASSKIITPLTLESKQIEGVNTRYTYEMIAPVQKYVAGSNLLSFDVNFTDDSETTISYRVSDKIFDTYGTTSQAGMIHNVRLTLSGNAEILLSGSDIEPWITAPTIANDLTNKITTHFSIKTTYTTANRVKVTTDEPKTYDIKNSDVANSVSFASDICTFYFTQKSSSPYDYGFKITELEFFKDNTSLGQVEVACPRVYSTTTLTLKLK